MAKAYFVGNIEIHDLEKYERYKAQVAATVEQYGGRYLVRGGAMESVEGAPPLPRIVILEFPSVEQAKAWYNSPEYAPILPLRLAASNGNAFVVEGL